MKAPKIEEKVGLAVFNKEKMTALFSKRKQFDI